MPESESVQIPAETMDRLRRLVEAAPGRPGHQSLDELILVLSLARQQDIANILMHAADDGRLVADAPELVQRLHACYRADILMLSNDDKVN